MHADGRPSCRCFLHCSTNRYARCSGLQSRSTTGTPPLAASHASCGPSRSRGIRRPISRVRQPRRQHPTRPRSHPQHLRHSLINARPDATNPLASIDPRLWPASHSHALIAMGLLIRGRLCPPIPGPTPEPDPRKRQSILTSPAPSTGSGLDALKNPHDIGWSVVAKRPPRHFQSETADAKGTRLLSHQLTCCTCRGPSTGRPMRPWLSRSAVRAPRP